MSSYFSDLKSLKYFRPDIRQKVCEVKFTDLKSVKGFRILCPKTYPVFQMSSVFGFEIHKLTDPNLGVSKFQETNFCMN